MGTAAVVITLTILLVGIVGTIFGWKVGRSLGFEDGWDAGVQAEKIRMRRITMTDERDTAPRPGARGHAVIRSADFRDEYREADEPEL